MRNLYIYIYSFYAQYILTSFYADSGDYKNELLRYMHADELPEFLGGSQRDPDGNPRCVTKVRQNLQRPA